MQNEQMNKFYMTEDRRSNTKDYFKALYQDLIKNFDVTKDFSICDIGCATGDFLWYMHTKLQEDCSCQISINGIDCFDELLKIAQKRCPFAKFQTGDINGSFLNTPPPV